ncbi:hypothetical protein RSAG8_03816, partial [Rhizoctonia solani AG-8 WAC10335]
MAITTPSTQWWTKTETCDVRTTLTESVGRRSTMRSSDRMRQSMIRITNASITLHPHLRTVARGNPQPDERVDMDPQATLMSRQPHNLQCPHRITSAPSLNDQIPTRHAYRRMYSYSEEDLGSPVNDTENVRPYSYDFAPAATPRYEEYHYPAAASEHRSKRHYERAAPPAPSRDPESAHRRAVRPDEPYQPMYADREPHSFVHPNPEHEVKEKKWWHRFKG